MLNLNSLVPKTYNSGTHRLIAPEETIARVRPFMAEMGITRIANVTGLDWIGLPVVMVCRPNSRSLAVSQGKGLDLAAAKASGLMETIELYHAERITLPLKLGSYEDLQSTHHLVEVTHLPRTTSSRFHPLMPLLWIEGYDLLQDRSIWVPYETVSTNASLPQPTGSGCFIATSNGLASGNHLLEAISHGICEVVERDATTLWHLLSEEERQQTCIDLDTIDDSSCREVLEKYDHAGIFVTAWETTTDIGIPSFICMIRERTEDQSRLLYTSSGMGCHPARHIALLRALTEAAQSRLTLISGSRDDVFRNEYEAGLRNVEDLRRYCTVIEDKSQLRDFCKVRLWNVETFNEDVIWELENLRAAGIRQVIAVNLTKSKFSLPVVRIIIPGLEGPDKLPGYLPGHRAQVQMKRNI
jgi:YcaO-like protein with predicted kinase domain